jgi:hypothetical protein
MTSLKHHHRRPTFHWHRRRMLLPEALESRSLLSAVPASVWVEQWGLDQGPLDPLPILEQHDRFDGSALPGDTPALPGLHAGGMLDADTLDLNSILFNLSADPIFNASQNGVGVINPSYDVVVTPPLIGLPGGDFLDGLSNPIIAVPISGSDFAYTNRLAEPTGGFQSYIALETDPTVLPSAAPLQEPQRILSPTTGSDPVRSEPDSHRDAETLPTDGPAFALTEPRLQELSTNGAAELSGGVSPSPNLNVDRSFDPATSTVDIAGILAQHATPRGPKPIGIDSTRGTAASVGMTGLRLSPRLVSQAASIVDSPHQGRLRMVELATDEPWLAQDRERAAERPVAIHNPETTRPAPIQRAPANLLPPATQEAIPAEEAIREDERPTSDSTTSHNAIPLKTQLTSQRISWDRYFHSIVGQWSRYLELAFSTAVATGMVFLFQLKARDQESEQQSAVQFRRWYTAAFMDKNNTIAAPNTSEK